MSGEAEMLAKEVSHLLPGGKRNYRSNMPCSVCGNIISAENCKPFFQHGPTYDSEGWPNGYWRKEIKNNVEEKDS